MRRPGRQKSVRTQRGQRRPPSRADRRRATPVDRRADRSRRAEHAAVLQRQKGRHARPGERRSRRPRAVREDRPRTAHEAVHGRGRARRRDPPHADDLPQGPRADRRARHQGGLPGHRPGPVGRAVPRAGRAGAAARAHHHPDEGQVRRLRPHARRRRRGEPGAAAQAGERVRRGRRQAGPRPHRRAARQGGGERRGARLHDREAQGHRHVHLRQAADGPRPGGGGRPARRQRPGRRDRRRPHSAAAGQRRPGRGRDAADRRPRG